MLLLAPCTPATGQPATRTDTLSDSAEPATVVPADSVRMIVLPETGEVGFIIPTSVALHYRSLVLDLLPALEQKIQLLEDASAQQLSLSDNHVQQINSLENQRDVLQEQVAIYASDATALQQQLEKVNSARKREIRRKKFWRSSNYLFMGTTALLTILHVVN